MPMIRSRGEKNERYEDRDTPFIHSPTKVEMDGTEINITQDGIVKLSKPSGTGEPDEIELPANVVITLAKLFEITKSSDITLEIHGNTVEFTQHFEDKDDKIRTSKDTLGRISSVLMATRRYKEPRG